jgi:hypothetical protein
MRLDLLSGPGEMRMLVVPWFMWYVGSIIMYMYDVILCTTAFFSDAGPLSDTDQPHLHAG